MYTNLKVFSLVRGVKDKKCTHIHNCSWTRTGYVINDLHKESFATLGNGQFN